MARFGVKATKGAANVQGVLYLNAAAASPRRAKVADLTLGCSAASNDGVHGWVFQRCTTAPTATPLTPNALDPADVLASTIVANNLVTVEGTLTANAFLDGFPVNGRSTFRWVPATPDFMLVIPAVANNGIMIGLDAATTTTYGVGAQYEE